MTLTGVIQRSAHGPTTTKHRRRCFFIPIIDQPCNQEIVQFFCVWLGWLKTTHSRANLFLSPRRITTTTNVETLIRSETPNMFLVLQEDLELLLITASPAPISKYGFTESPSPDRPAGGSPESGLYPRLRFCFPPPPSSASRFT